jgi:DevC protein
LLHEKKRSSLAVGGMLVATLLIFLQLGFYYSVPAGGTVFYDALQFDVVITGSDYVSQGQPNAFPRRRIYQSMALPEVKSVAAVYQGKARWDNEIEDVARDVFVMGFNPNDGAFRIAEIEEQLPLLTRPDSILIDRSTRREFGPLEPGRLVEINQRAVQIIGDYRIGTGFLALGAAITSDLNFIRLFKGRTLSQVNLGLVTLQSGVNPRAAVQHIQRILPEDSRAWTREEFLSHERSHWATRTSAGLIFGFGVLVALIVGLVILYQTLATQIARQLPQFATLKAMGYTNGYLVRVVVAIGTILIVMSYFPAATFATVIYSIMRRITILPIEMTTARLIAVFLIGWGMSILSALLCIRVLRRADPVELF